MTIGLSHVLTWSDPLSQAASAEDVAAKNFAPKKKKTKAFFSFLKTLPPGSLSQALVPVISSPDW